MGRRREGKRKGKWRKRGGMDGWMDVDGRMNGRMDEWTNVRMDEWTNGRMDEWMNG